MFIERVLFVTVISLASVSTDGAKILGVFPMAAPSHYFLGHALMKGLAEAGHDVTMISPFEDDTPPNKGRYSSVVLTGFVEDYKKLLGRVNLLNTSDSSIAEFMFSISTELIELGDKFFSHENVRGLLKSNETFDLVIVEQFMNDPMKIFGPIYNAPVIAFSTIGASPWVNNMLGNPTPISYVPQMGQEYSPHMTFKERIVNVFSYLLLQAMEIFYIFPRHNAILKKHFPDAPDVYDLFYNVSLVFLNSHESLNQAVPYVPNMVAIGGFHVKPPKKLPKDLQEYLDSAKDGVIYFSMGSNLKSKDLPAYKRDALLKAFGKLKEKVIWKWEDDNLPGRPDNVRVGKWFPQQDILAHPNVKLFMTHGGLLSTTEAVYHGVPLLAIPVFGDQPVNAKMATEAGYALNLPYGDPSFSEERLSGLLNELLSNPKYKRNAKKKSELFHDRPMKPMDLAAYWVDYVIRHGDVSHLKVAGVRFPWYKYHSIDVISFLVIIILLIVHVVALIIKKVFSCWGIRSSSKSKAKRE